MMLGLSKLVTRLLAIAVVVLLVAGFLSARSCQQARQKAAQARVDAAQGSAAQESAKDAIASQGATNERERASEELTRTNEKDIRDAEGADIKISPDVSAAALRSLCRRAAYRDNPKCRVQ